MAYHEEGHLFGLGHSSVQADVMYWKYASAESVTGNAQDGLDAIYGPYNNGSSGDGGCSTCQTVCGSAEHPCQPSPTVPINLEGYLAKVWDMSQGVSPPNPVSELDQTIATYQHLQDPCTTYFEAKNYVPWAQCEATFLQSALPPV